MEPTERTSEPWVLELVVLLVVEEVVLVVEPLALEELVVELLAVEVLEEVLEVVEVLLVVLVVDEVVLVVDEVVFDVLLVVELVVVLLVVDPLPEYVEPLKVKVYVAMSVAAWSPGEENSPTASPSSTVVPTPMLLRSNGEGLLSLKGR